jgi:hypothetical protein
MSLLAKKFFKGKFFKFWQIVVSSSNIFEEIKFEKNYFALGYLYNFLLVYQLVYQCKYFTFLHLIKTNL